MNGLRRCGIYTQWNTTQPKQNKIMSFAATRMKLEVLILSKISQQEKRQIPYDITYIWNLIYGTNEPIYRKERNSQTWRRDLWLPRGREREWDGLRDWGQQMQTTFRVNKQ